MGGSRIGKWCERWGRNLLIGAAASLAFAGAGFIAYEADGPKRVYEHQTAEKAKGEADRAQVKVKAECLRLPPADKAECEHQQEQTARQAHHDEVELQAQRETAAWTRGMGLAALIAMVFGIVGVGLVYLTFDAQRRGIQIAEREYRRARAATRRAAEEARNATAAMIHSNQIMEEGQRPWIMIEPELIEFGVDDTLWSIGIRVKFTNVGKSAAVAFNPHVEIVFPPDSNIGVAIEPAFEKLREPWPNLHASVIPGDYAEMTLKHNYRVSEIPWRGEPGREHFFCVVVIGARYRLSGHERSEDKKSQKLTARAYYVGEPSPDYARATMIFKDGFTRLCEANLAFSKSFRDITR